MVSRNSIKCGRNATTTPRSAAAAAASELRLAHPRMDKRAAFDMIAALRHMPIPMTLTPLTDPSQPALQRPPPPAGVIARLLGRPIAAFGVAVIVIIAALAAAAPLVAPYDPAEQIFDGL